MSWYFFSMEAIAGCQQNQTSAQRTYSAIFYNAYLL